MNEGMLYSTIDDLVSMLFTDEWVCLYRARER